MKPTSEHPTEIWSEKLASPDRLICQTMLLLSVQASAVPPSVDTSEGNKVATPLTSSATSTEESTVTLGAVSSLTVMVMFAVAELAPSEMVKTASFAPKSPQVKLLGVTDSDALHVPYDPLSMAAKSSASNV